MQLELRASAEWWVTVSIRGARKSMLRFQQRRLFQRRLYRRIHIKDALRSSAAVRIPRSRPSGHNNLIPFCPTLGAARVFCVWRGLGKNDTLCLCQTRGGLSKQQNTRGVMWPPQRARRCRIDTFLWQNIRWCHSITYISIAWAFVRKVVPRINLFQKMSLVRWNYSGELGRPQKGAMHHTQTQLRIIMFAGGINFIRPGVKVFQIVPWHRNMKKIHLLTYLIQIWVGYTIGKLAEYSSKNFVW